MNQNEKRTRYSGIIVPLSFMAIVTCILGFLLFLLPPDKDISQNIPGGRPLQLQKWTTISQSFIAGQNNLEGIAITLKTAKGESLSKTDNITYRIQDGTNGKIISVGTVDNRQLKNDPTVRFKFSTIENSAGKKYSVRLTSGNAASEPRISAGSAVPGASLSVNRKRIDVEVRMSAIYKHFSLISRMKNGTLGKKLSAIFLLGFISFLLLGYIIVEFIYMR